MVNGPEMVVYNNFPILAAKAIYIIDYGNYGAVIHEYQAVIYDTLYLKKKIQFWEKTYIHISK